LSSLYVIPPVCPHNDSFNLAPLPLYPFALHQAINSISTL
jgi:hypothetical protein